MPGQVPSWLLRFKNADYLAGVLETLEKRESSREILRSTARQRASAFHRRPGSQSQLPSNYNSQGHLVDHYDVSTGYHPDNSHFNRYIQLEPYNRTRVAVGNPGGQEQYLNANWVQELHGGGKWWIATQAPVPASIHTFLRLIMQNVVNPPGSPAPTSSSSRQVRTVVQLTLDFESGRRKAHSYFPSEVGKAVQVNAYIAPVNGRPYRGTPPTPLITTLVAQSEIAEAHCVLSTVSVREANAHPSTAVLFRHLLFTSWPDHGVPAEENTNALFNFAKLVDERNRTPFPNTQYTPVATTPDPDPPIMINCSAGVGRTGSFIAISSLLRRHGFLPPTATPWSCMIIPSPLGAMPPQFAYDEVCQEIDALREQRPSMVQRDEQVLLIYKMLMEAFEKHQS